MKVEIGSALRGLALGSLALTTCAHAGGFTGEERSAIVLHWNEPARHLTTAPPSVAQLGAWQVRLTPEASRWLCEYDRARGLSKTSPAEPLPKAAGQELVGHSLSGYAYLSFL